jgi:hypothetical protein
MSPARAILYGTLAVGTLDALDAIVFFWLRSGVSAGRIFQSIAAGLLGRASYDGGASTIALGIALHFFIAFGIAATFVVASRYLPFLRRAPIPSGIAYGIAVYLFMNFVVVPLSAAGGGTPRWPVVVNGVLIHMFGVGLPPSLFASRIRWSRFGRV